MIEYVLVCQGIEIKRSSDPYEIISLAINNNMSYYDYLQCFNDEYESSSYNEMEVYKEVNGEGKRLNLSIYEQIITRVKFDERVSVIDEAKDFIGKYYRDIPFTVFQLVMALLEQLKDIY